MKRIVCLLLALVLITGAVPLTTFAEEETCTCETACTAENHNANCTVCATNIENCSKKPSGTPEPTPAPKCTCTSKCTEESSNQECEVCKTNSAACSYVEPVTYTVTYKDAEGSNSFLPQTDVVNAGAATPAFKGTLSREGFLFDGWNPEVTETVTADVTYTAKWAEAVTITYKDGKDGEIFTDQIFKVKKGADMPKPTLAESYTSWTFSDWDTAPGEKANESATYTAQWEEKGANKLVLNANHSSITENPTSESTSEASSIAIPTTSWSVEQYELNGWNTQADGKGTSYGQNATVNFDGPHNGQTITLYAQWVSVEGRPTVGDEDVQGILNGHNVKIAVVGDDTFSIDKDAKDVAGAYELKGNDDDGYTLEVTLSIGTTTETACKTEINEHYTPTGETTKTDDWRCVEPKSQTVAFKWEEGDDGGWKPPVGTEGMTLATFYMNQYFTVTYTDGVDGVEVFEDQTTSVVKGEDTPAFTGNTDRTGYAFKGWDKEVADKVTADVTYTAQWTANTYTVKFDANGGTGTMADQTLIYDKAEKLTKNTFTRKGYKFMYWREKEKGAYYWDQEEVTNLAPSGEVTLVAQWEPSVERVDFSLSGYGYKKEITSAKVTPGTNKGVSYGDNYSEYGNNYGITKDSPSTARLDSGTFADNKAYYLYVKFYVNQEYTCADLTKNDVFLDGVPAISLTGNEEDQPAAQALDDEENPGTELTAVFKLKTIYLIKASAGKNGSISPKDTVAVFEGDDVTFTITPDKGYVRSTLKVDDKKVPTAKTYTFNDVQRNHKIHATFAKDSGNAKTGDDLRILWATAAAVLSAAALTTALVIAKKKKKK